MRTHLENEARLILPLSSEQRDAVAGVLRTLLPSFEDAARPVRRRGLLRT